MIRVLELFSGYGTASLKRCSKCKEELEVKNFYIDKRRGYTSQCKKCCKNTTDKSIIKKWGTMNNYYANYRNKIIGGNPSIIYSKKMFNAKSHNIPFKITREYFIEWYNNEKKECVYCGIKMKDIEKNKDMMPNINIFRLTLDRINPNLGYEEGNICLCCARCNLIKNDFFSDKEMKEIGRKYVKPKWKD
jgi:hypothetical protein